MSFKTTSSYLLFLLLITFGLAGCGSSATVSKTTLKIQDTPIVFDQERIELSRAYLRDRYGIVQNDATIRPQMVVVHWTAIDNFKESLEAFYPPKLPNSRPDISSAGSLNVSAHYLVDRDGTVHRLMPDTLMARHVIGLNHCAIGIENVGGTKDTPLTKAQFQANLALVKELSNKYSIKYLIGHYEYTLFEGHELWKELDAGYRTEKTDPGVDFMQDLRKELSDLELKGPPGQPITTAQ
ncbi:N-acetylmuramoyl-L-alanine amidase [Robiginitalea myxolifaciens]|uniref:N-acetylmuramoyl-L-alanine amidase n=1 Tax=Robiginitalea myxolifaciens TaxID=400055 RepID=UPI0029371025|nr:peptidoglycan recognition family protein [Robiginitalea myxolifaciens]